MSIIDIVRSVKLVITLMTNANAELTIRKCKLSELLIISVIDIVSIELHAEIYVNKSNVTMVTQTNSI